MAANTDQDTKKKKTLPLQTHQVPPGGDYDGDVIEGELIDEGETPEAPADPGKPAKERSATRGERRTDRDQKRNHAWDERRAREGKTPPPPAPGATHPDGTPRPANTPAAQLRLNVDQAGKQFMANVRKADIYTAKRAPKERRSQLTGIHKGYVSMMVLSCVQPLSEGVNAKAVLSVVGMGAAMWTMSPNFRDQIGDFADQMKEAVTSKIDERKQSRIDKVKTQAGKKEVARSEKDKPLSQRWEKKLERAERSERGGRDAFTAQSAGMTEVALTENAYAAMRVEGANVDEIRDAHGSTLRDLYAQAAEDGVDADEIATAARVVVGLRLDEEPELAAVFGELSHGQFAKSAPRDVRVNGAEETSQVWTGEFESRLGQPITAGSFGVRAPMDAAEHQAAIADTMTADMLALTRDQGVAGLNVGVVSYAAAWGLKDRPDIDGLVAMDNPLGERLRTSRVMLNTMDADSFSSAEQQRIYSNAYVDSLELVSTLHPEVEQEWAAQFGTNWRENMRDFVDNPQQYMGKPGGESEAEADYEQEPGTAWEAGPGSGQGKGKDGKAGDGPAKPAAPGNTSAAATRKYRAALINQNYIQTTQTGVHGMGKDDSDHRDQDFQMGG